MVLSLPKKGNPDSARKRGAYRAPGCRLGDRSGGQDTLAIAETTASMFLLFSAATQIRPESTP